MQTIQLTDKEIRTLIDHIATSISMQYRVTTDGYRNSILSNYTNKEYEKVKKERLAEIAYLKGLSNKLAHSQD